MRFVHPMDKGAIAITHIVMILSAVALSFLIGIIARLTFRVL